jgi:hypothetical protein
MENAAEFDRNLFLFSYDDKRVKEEFWFQLRKN